jgi:DNA polymerase-3 subunit epsilon
MELKLKPFCFSILKPQESTLEKIEAKISILKVFRTEITTWLVNPTIPIPPQTTAVHGITDDEVGK